VPDDEAFVEGRQLLRHDAALDHLEAALLGEPDHRLAGDAVEEAIGDRRVDDAVRTKKMLAPVHSATRPCQSSIIASA
jgi:hypothetical protein